MESETTERAARPGSAGARGILIVMNPHSGKKKSGERALRLREEVVKHPERFILHEVATGADLGQAVARGLREGYGTIAAAGGDGTICAVATALAGTGCRLGIIPLGTFNYFARAHGVPEDIEEALRALTEGTARPLSIGEVNGRIFLNNASLGAYSKVLESRERIYARFGRSRIAAYWSVLVALASFRSRLSVTMTVDGEAHRLKTPLIFVANNAYQLDLFHLEGTDAIREGKLVALVAPDVGRLGLIAFAVRLAIGGSARGRDFELLAGREIVVETRRRGTVVARDGERGRMSAPFRFRVRPGAVELITPAAAEI